ncbi:hypothetical protein FRC10_009342 [Ceratobasidium sp. 414]|nr:hypothetical protein FRC10_009342 [Ceratobasidium sp. 414]
MACPLHASKDPPPLFVGGTVHFQARHVGWIVSGGFTAVAVVASLWLIQKHASITLASYIFLTHATSLLLIRDAYESVVLASFFTLMLQYLPGPVPPPPPEHGKPRIGSHKRSRSWSRHSRSGSHRTGEDGEEVQPITLPDRDPNPEAEKSTQMSKAERRAAIHQTFHALQMRPSPGSDSAPSKPPFKWLWPLGSIRVVPRDGLAYLQYMRWGILQYCIVRPGSAAAAVILQQFGLYCEASWSPKWGHVWIVTAISISVTVAMYCLVQLYITISEELKPYKPLLKLFSIKAVVFLTFWQSALLVGLASLNIIKDTEYMTAEDITIGFGALLQTFEMMCFAFLHVKAFSYQPYKRLALSPSSSHTSPLPASSGQQLRNLAHAFDFSDTFKDLHSGILYHFGRGPSKQADEACQRDARFREVFGRERVLPPGGGRIRGVADGGDNQDGDDSVPRSFTKTRGYRGLPVTDDLDDSYTTMYAAIRPIRRPMPELNPDPLPTPQTSPTRVSNHRTPIMLDDPAPASVWRMQAGVRPLPPGAYIPRLPGSPGLWMGPRGGRVGSRGSRELDAEGQRPGFVTATPPPTPPLSPLVPLSVAPGRQATRSGMGRNVSSFMVERDAGSLMVGRNPTSLLAQVNTASHAVEGHIDLSGAFGMHTFGAHIPPASPSRHRPLAPNVRLSAIPNPGAPSPPFPPRHSDSRHASVPQPPLHPRIPGARSPSPALSISEDMHPPSRDDSLLARMFSGTRSAETGYTALETVARSVDARSTESSSYRTAPDGASSRSVSPSVETSGERSSGAASYRTWERAVVRAGQVVVLEQNSESGYRPQSVSVAALGTLGNEISQPSSFGPPLAPPSPARPVRHVGPNVVPRQELDARARPQGPSTQPRTIMLPAPLSPARYPHWPWRAPAPQETRPVPWSPLQGQQNSFESGLAGWAAGRSAVQRGESSPVVAAHANGSSWLSNIEDRYPAMGPQSPRDLGMPR